MHIIPPIVESKSRSSGIACRCRLQPFFWLLGLPSSPVCPLPLPEHHSTNRSHPSSLVVPSHPIRRYRSPSLARSSESVEDDGRTRGWKEPRRRGRKLFPLEQRSIQRQRVPSARPCPRLRPRPRSTSAAAAVTAHNFAHLRYALRPTPVTPLETRPFLLL